MHTNDASVFYDAPISRTGRPSIPAIIVSCSACERTIGDSTAFVAGSRDSHTITFSEVVSITTGDGKLETATSGAWDEFCSYMNLYCEKCETKLGKKYFAITPHLMHIQGKYTLDVSKLSFYQLGSKTPSLPSAETAEIMDLIQPKPDELGEKLTQVMMLCVLLREEQENIQRALRKLGRSTGVDLSEEVPSEEQPDEQPGPSEPEWKKMYQELVGRVRGLERWRGEAQATVSKWTLENKDSPMVPSSRRQSELLNSDDEPLAKRHKSRPSSSSGKAMEPITRSPLSAVQKPDSETVSVPIRENPETNVTLPKISKAPLKVMIENTLPRANPLQTQAPPAQDVDEPMEEDVIRKTPNKARVKETPVEVIAISDSQDDSETWTTQDSKRSRQQQLSDSDYAPSKSKAAAKGKKAPAEKRRASGRATRAK